MWPRGSIAWGLGMWIGVIAAAAYGLGAAGPQLAGAGHALAGSVQGETGSSAQGAAGGPGHGLVGGSDSWTLLFVLLLATFVGLGVILRVSRLLHTPLMSLTNAISAIAVVGAILVTGANYPLGIRILGAVALFASMTNIVSGFLITDRMLRMFKQDRQESRA